MSERVVIENKAEVFADWADHYAKIKAKVFNSHGLGLCAASPAQEGDVLVDVPPALIIDESTISDLAMSDPDLAKWLALQPVTGRHRLHRALVYLALVKAPAKWVVYLKLLPTNQDIDLPF